MSWGAGHRSRPIQCPHNIAATDGWILCRRPREPSCSQCSTATASSKPSGIISHRPNGMCMATGPDPCLHRRRKTVGRNQPRLPNIAARQHPHFQRQGRAGPKDARRSRPRPVHNSPHGIAVDGHGNIYAGERQANLGAAPTDLGAPAHPGHSEAGQDLSDAGRQARLPRLLHDEETDQREVGTPPRRRRSACAEMIIKRAGEPAAERHPRHSAKNIVAPATTPRPRGSARGSPRHRLG